MKRRMMKPAGYTTHPNSPHPSQHLTPDHAFDPLDQATKMSMAGLGPPGAGGPGGGGLGSVGGPGSGTRGGLSPMPQGFPPYRPPE